MLRQERLSDSYVVNQLWFSTVPLHYARLLQSAILFHSILVKPHPLTYGRLEVTYFYKDFTDSWMFY